MKNVRAWKFSYLVLFLIGLNAVAQAQGFSVVYQFNPSKLESANPSNPGIIAQGRDGNLYSSTTQGGNIFNATGTVFEIVPPNAYSLKFQFNNADGNAPSGGLTLGTDGNFYGATQTGGTHQWGVVYKMTSGASETVLHSFTGVSPEGSIPVASPIQGTDGNFYGTTWKGGINGLGTVYKITPTGTFNTLYSFDRLHGAEPLAPLVQGTDGLFYGVTFDGGNSTNYGTVFKISSAGHVTVLYNFKNDAHGADPVGGLTQGLDGNFYGTTERGGGTPTPCTRGDGGCGTVFKITPSGALTTLYHFAGGSDGRYPDGGLVQASDGNFYGTTAGDTTSCGTIFRITPAGAFSTLHTFDNTNGCHPQVTLLQRTTGVLYGDTHDGGLGGLGQGIFYSLDLGLPSFVSILPPLTVGKVGKTIEILGQGFTGTSSVSFNGASANFTVVSDTYLTAVVPNGALTGFVTVNTLSGNLTSNKKFRVTPQVKSFTPLSGSVGSSITITGISLTQTSRVTIGGIKASFKVVNDSTVTATVPTGAVTGKKITITTLGGSATSPSVLTVM
jgi:uncharacterized repeat protein (TIGR03803 family)